MREGGSKRRLDIKGKKEREREEERRNQCVGFVSPLYIIHHAKLMWRAKDRQGEAETAAEERGADVTALPAL